MYHKSTAEKIKQCSLLYNFEVGIWIMIKKVANLLNPGMFCCLLCFQTPFLFKYASSLDYVYAINICSRWYYYSKYAANTESYKQPGYYVF